MAQFTLDDGLWLVLEAALVLVLYVYVGYPLLLGALGLLRRRGRHQTGSITPRVTLIIPAYNERKVIREKLENSLRLDYPADCLEILVVSDGSEDGTNDIVGAYEPRGVKLL